MCRQLDVHFNDEPHNCDNPAKNYGRLNFSSIMQGTHLGQIVVDLALYILYKLSKSNIS